MDKRHRNIIDSEAQYTKIYKEMRGVDLTGAESSPEQRYAYAENMYIDYDGDGLAIESVPGFRKIYSFDAPINGIYTQNLNTGRLFLLIHAGEKLYRIDEVDIDHLGYVEPIATLENKRSCSYTVGRTIYIIDGVRILAIDENGTCETVSDDAESAPYVPLTYRNRKRYEQRNLLTDKFRESFVLTAAEEASYGTYGLKYRVINALERTCAVVGADATVSGSVHIPSYVEIAGTTYAVTEIGKGAFWGNEGITELITNHRLQRIGRHAFWNAKNLSRVILSSTVEMIDEYGFYGCSGITYLYLGASFREFGIAALAATSTQMEIHYELDAESLALIKNVDILGERPLYYHVSHNEVSLGLRLMTPTASVSRVTVDGEAAEYAYDPRSATVRMDFASVGEIEGREITVYGYIDNSGYTPEISEGDYLSTRVGRRMTPRACILGSRVSETFDGRIFLSGNPSLGGSVFYNTSPVGEDPHPLYFGSLCYFVDGVNDHPVNSLLASHGALAVFKSGDDTSGSIFYHTPTGVKSAPYSTSYVHSRINVLGHAHNYNDESVFITSDGVAMLDKYSSYGYREVRKRSSAVDKLLSRSITEGGDVADWLGYLVIGGGGTLFLGDARKRREKYSSGEYEWFIINGVGTYKNSTRVYRYADSATSGYYIHEKVGEPAQVTVYSYTNAYGSIYYTVECGKKYAVVPTEEFTGGDFYPATILHSVGKRLYFATECGDLCVFNNDMRGVPPSSIADRDDFDADAYASVMGEKIHPEFYLFDKHAPRYSLVTAWDDCGVPYLTKTTVGNSMVIKCKSIAGGKLHVEVESDVEGSRGFGSIAIDAVDASDGILPLLLATTDKHTVAVNDRTHSFCEKRIAISSEDPHAPFGVYSISYRYRIKGKIKRKELT